MKELNERYAWSVRIGEKGQFVIPKEARDLFNIKPGDTLLVLGDKKKGIAIPPKGMFQELAKTVFAGEESKGEEGKGEEGKGEENKGAEGNEEELK